MSSTAQPATAEVQGPPVEVVLISHSPLFYWWPVWAVGFLMAGLSYWEGYRVAFVPDGTVARRGVEVAGQEGPRDVLVAPRGERLPGADGDDEAKQPQLRMSLSNSLGIVWAMTLCVVITITHTDLRGVRSLLMIGAIVIVTVLLALLGWWDPILSAIRVFDIHMTSSSYLSISLFLFVIWLVRLLVFDRLVYMVFTRGQMRVRAAIGDGEMVFDTRGLVVERHGDDIFRHWLLGFGMGDLTVKTAGNNSRQFEMPNVFGVTRKLSLIHTMLQEREVVRGSR